MNKTKLYTLGPIIASGAVGLAAIVLTIGVGANGAANSSSAGWFGTRVGSTGTTFNRNYFTRQSYTTPTLIECDVYPRGSGDGRVTQEDYDLIGRFSVGTEKATNGAEFQKADCAPKGSLGDGKIDVADWVQAGRYWEGLDSVQTAGGPTEPVKIAYECDVWPRETAGDGRVTQEDYDLIGKLSVGSETAQKGLEFQKADSAVRSTLGDGQIVVSDWVQCGRYLSGLDPLTPVGGPTEPVSVVYEGDVWPRPNGDGRITQEDYDQVGRFSVGLDVPQNESEFQRADVAPKDTTGDGQIVVSDWVQTGRYWQNLDPLQTVGGPSGPGQ